MAIGTASALKAHVSAARPNQAQQRRKVGGARNTCSTASHRSCVHGQPAGSLAKHVNFVHLKLREHARPYCPGVAYQTKSDLTRHIEAVHEKRRAHACGYCKGVAFGTARVCPR